MAVPTFQINISGSVIALYAAAVATVLAIFQIISFLRDRPKVKITVQSNADFHSASANPDDDPYTTVTVANDGRRPVTITFIGGYRLYPGKGFTAHQCSPSLPQELTEGKHLAAFLDETEYDLSELECWHVYDAVGHTYRLPVAPLYKRLISRFRRKRSRRRIEKAKKELTADQ
jgi:hypothetical protein